MTAADTLPTPLPGPGNGALMVRPADRTEPRGPGAWELDS